MEREKQDLIDQIRRLDIAQLCHELSMEAYHQSTADRLDKLFRLSLEAILLDVRVNKQHL